MAARKGMGLCLPSVVHCLLLNKKYFIVYLLNNGISIFFAFPLYCSSSSRYVSQSAGLLKVEWYFSLWRQVFDFNLIFFNYLNKTNFQASSSSVLSELLEAPPLTLNVKGLKAKWILS